MIRPTEPTEPTEPAEPSEPTRPQFSLRRRRLNFALTALAATGYANRLTGASETTPAQTRFHLIGDTPYSAQEQALLASSLPSVGRPEDFIIHVGDIKSGIEHCSDQLLADRLSTLDQARCPLVLVPGDNEWTDCHRVLAGSFAPMERLQWLRRQVFNPARGYTLGKGRLAITSQRNGLPENLRWSTANCQFVTLNVPGSQFGLKAGIPDDVMTAIAEADLRWLDQALEHAIQQQLAVLVVSFHAELRTDKLSPDDVQRGAADPSRPYGWLRAAMHRIVCRFPGTVVLLHGDRHQYRYDNPWEQAARSALPDQLPGYGVAPAVRRERMARFTRLRSFGTPAAAAYVSISIDSRAGQPPALTVTPRLI